MSYTENMKKISEIAYKEKIPLVGVLELTEKCNLRCKFCYMYDRNQRMYTESKYTTEQWLNVIKAAVDMGMIKCILTGGEVLALKDFKKIYSTIYDMGVVITLFTNGLLMDEETVEFLTKRPPDRISMTVYGASNETYKLVTGDEKGFDKAINAIKLMKNANLNLRIRTIAIKPLKNEFKDIKKIAEEFDLPIGFVTFLMETRNENEKKNLDWRMSPEEVLEGFKIIKGRYPKLDINNSLDEEDVCCGSITRFGITYDGLLVPCLGFCETKTYPFRDGFKNALYELREKFGKVSYKCDECKSCEAKNTCTKCPSSRFLETGSANKCSEYFKKLAKLGVS